MEIFNKIEEKLICWWARIKNLAKLNLTDINIFSENYIAKLMNLLFDFNLINFNEAKSNSEAIDLIDKDKKIIVQVSSVCTKEKIINTLNKEILKNYNKWTFYYVSLGKEIPKKWDNSLFNNPYNLNFKISDNFLDIAKIIRKIKNILDDEKLKSIYSILPKFYEEPKKISNFESILVKIIERLSSEDLTEANNFSPEIREFKIEEKINFNDLQEVKEHINQYKIYYSRLDKIYNEFDSQGKNRSIATLNSIRNEFIKLNSQKIDPNEIFYKIIDLVFEKVKDSANKEKIYEEETIKMCVYILVVDAFIRCKIFKNPNDYKKENYAITR